MIVRKLLPLLTLSLSLVAVASACAADEPAAAADATGDSLDRAGADASDAAATADVPVGACNDLVNGGDMVPESAGVVFFGPMGGTVADGTYHLTEFKIFPPGSVDPHLRRHTLRVTGERIEIVTQRDGEGEVRMNATMAVTGDTVTFTVDCPQPSSYSFGYTTNDTQFIHIIDGPGIKETHTYTLQ